VSSMSRSQGTHMSPVGPCRAHDHCRAMGPRPAHDGRTVGFDRPRLHHSRGRDKSIYVVCSLILCSPGLLSSLGIQGDQRPLALHTTLTVLDVVPCSVGIGTCSPCVASQWPGDSALQTRHANVEPCPDMERLVGRPRAHLSRAFWNELSGTEAILMNRSGSIIRRSMATGAMRGASPSS